MEHEAQEFRGAKRNSHESPAALPLHLPAVLQRVLANPQLLTPFLAAHSVSGSGAVQVLAIDVPLSGDLSVHAIVRHGARGPALLVFGALCGEEEAALLGRALLARSEAQRCARLLERWLEEQHVSLQDPPVLLVGERFSDRLRAACAQLAGTVFCAELGPAGSEVARDRVAIVERERTPDLSAPRIDADDGLFEDAAQRILRIAEEIRRSDVGDRTHFTVRGRALAELVRAPGGCQLSIGGAANDLRSLNSVSDLQEALEEVVRHYLFLSAGNHDPVGRSGERIQ